MVSFLTRRLIVPWKACSMSQQRLVLIHQVLTAGRGVSEVAREFGVSRKTAYKWLGRYRGESQSSLEDRSRRPLRSPLRTQENIEQAVLDVRRRHNWGPRKIRRVLLDQQLTMPSLRTVAAILSRHGCVGASDSPHHQPHQPFERGCPNELWQLDHKGPIEVARQRVTPLTVLDDYSRYCLRFEPVTDVTMATAWNVLWELFGEVGLPQAILCDNAFGGAHHTVGLSWFDARLVALDIQPLHGRPYHPQTQGKVERLHGTVQRELIDFDARRDCLKHFCQDAQRWRTTYNTLRPHEALQDHPPVIRYRPSERKRPAKLPQIEYAPGSIVRRVSQTGDFRYHNARIVVVRALTRQTVRIEERQHDIGVYYGWKLLRVIPHAHLCGPRSDKMV